MPRDVAAAIADYSDDGRTAFLRLRDLIFEVAASLDVAGEVSESLKWGQPSYSMPGGTPVRLAPARGDARAVGVYTSCQTPLVADFALEHGEVFDYDAGRGIHIPVDAALPRRELADFIAAAFTYKSRRAARG